jgi:hypothetical protein
VRELQPEAALFSDAGPDVRWAGNEKGVAGDPAWATLNRADFAPGEADERRLNRGDRPGTDSLPAECSFREPARGASIGSRRLWRGDPVTTSRMRLRITQAAVAPAIAELALHRQPAAATSR